jgi:hypothetical protein
MSPRVDPLLNDLLSGIKTAEGGIKISFLQVRVVVRVCFWCTVVCIYIQMTSTCTCTNSNTLLLAYLTLYLVHAYLHVKIQMHTHTYTYYTSPCVFFLCKHACVRIMPKYSAPLRSYTHAHQQLLMYVSTLRLTHAHVPGFGACCRCCRQVRVVACAGECRHHLGGADEQP